MLDRYRKRFYADADVLEGLRQMHYRNYDKASEPLTYKGKPAIASAVEDGYFLGDGVCDDAISGLPHLLLCGGAKETALREMRKLLD